MLDLSKRRRSFNDWTWTSEARCQALPATNTFSQSSMSIPDSPLLSLVLIWPRKPSFRVWRNCFRFLECARTFILINGHLFNPMSWNLGCTHTELPRVELQASTPGAMGNARNSTVLYGKLYIARWSPGSSLWLTGRIPCQMRFTLFVPCVHQRTELPTKECFIMLGDLSMELPFRRGWNQALFMWNATLKIRTSPWLTKLNYWKSTPAMPTFVWTMDEKQPSRFVIFHLEVFVMPLYQVFPSPHPVMTIDLLTTAVRQMKKTRKILFLPDYSSGNYEVSCKKRWT